MQDDPRARIHAFEQQLYLALGHIVAALYKDLRGEVSEESKRIIYERLAALSDRAADLPEGIGVLDMLDRLVAMFPPPAQ